MFNQLKIYNKSKFLVCSINNSFSLYSFYKYEKETYDRIIISPNNKSCFLSIITIREEKIIKELNFSDKYLILKNRKDNYEKVFKYNLEKDTIHSKLTIFENGKTIEKERYVDGNGKVEHNIYFSIEQKKLNEILKKLKENE